jgi:hypothetical protein
VLREKYAGRCIRGNSNKKEDVEVLNGALETIP